MKMMGPMKSIFPWLSLMCVLASCASRVMLEAPASGTLGIRVAEEQTVEHRFGKAVFPAGMYAAEAQSAEGIYYAAPAPVKTGGVIHGGKEHGGLFLDKQGRQALWIGQPGYQLQQAPGTVLGNWGVETPITYGLRTPLVFERR
jgi:hypothetical protein